MQPAAATPLRIRPSVARRIASLGRQAGHDLPAAAIVAALDALQADVMVADNDLTITSMNKAVIGLRAEAHADLGRICLILPSPV